MDIVVVGTGYVGIVTGTCLAETGNRVICVDIDEEKIAMMEQGKVPIYEPHLESLLVRNLEAERISFTTDLEAAVKASPIVFLALPTPPGEDGSADLQYVLKVADQLGLLQHAEAGAAGGRGWERCWGKGGGALRRCFDFFDGGFFRLCSCGFVLL